MPEWKPVARCEVRLTRQAEIEGKDLSEADQCPERVHAILHLSPGGVCLFVCEKHATGAERKVTP